MSTKKEVVYGVGKEGLCSHLNARLEVALFCGNRFVYRLYI
jgi:hypothetical protein